MSKLSKEELIKKVSEKVEDSDLQVELMEDISDSFEVDSDSVSAEEFKEMSDKYEKLREDYKSRFLEVKEEPKKEESQEELEEKNYVDVKDI